MHAGFEVQRDATRAAVLIRGRVDARTADKPISTKAPKEDIVTIATVEDIIPTPTVDLVIPCSANKIVGTFCSLNNSHVYSFLANG